MSKKTKMDPGIWRKSPPPKVLVTPVLPVEEDAWNKDWVEIELSYSESASPAHIKGVTFASPEKVAPVNEKTGVEPEEAYKDVHVIMLTVYYRR